MASQSTSSQTPSDYKLDMSTSFLLQQITADVGKFAPTSRVSVSPGATWTEALAEASKSLDDQDRATLIFPQTSKERREAIRKLALSEVSRSCLAYIGRGIRTPFPTDVTPPPARPGTKERVRKLAREALAQGYRQPYVFNIRALLTESTLATVSGSLTLEMIDDEDDDKSATCKLVLKDMLWDTGSHGCTITADLLPERFASRLAESENDPYRDESGTMVRVQGYLALSNSQLFFESIFTVVPSSTVPNGRRGVILGQRCFMDHMDFRQMPRGILEGHGNELKNDEWGDIKIIEWIDPVTGETQTFPEGGS